MSYRKINVNGEIYKYVIGKTHLKIHGRQAVPLSEVGAELGKKIIITPRMIKDYILGIKGDKSKYFPTCEHENVPKEIGYIPYDEEIYGKKIIVNWCDDCYNENANDI